MDTIIDTVKKKYNHEIPYANAKRHDIDDIDDTKFIFTILNLKRIDSIRIKCHPLFQTF
jgi:hypothetical protein